jgi:hypothetical protein
MAGGARADRGGPVSPTAPGRMGVAQAAALLATGAAAVSLVAGLGTYLYLRFTQQRRRPPSGSAQPGGPPPAPEKGPDR